jgi:hypothetical protein
MVMEMRLLTIGLLFTLLIGAVGVGRWAMGLQRGRRLAAAQVKTTAPVAPLNLNATGLLIIFGVTDKEPTDWSGEISVSTGEIIALSGWRLGPKAAIEGNRFFLNSRFAGPQQKQIIPPGLFVTLQAPEDATVRVATKQGEFSFRLGEIVFGQPKLFLDGRVRVERIPASFRLTSATTEEDFPVAVTDAKGNLWVAFTVYTHGGQPNLGEPLTEEPKDFEFLRPKGNGDQIWLMSFDGKRWSEPMPVTEKGLDVWKPTVALDGRGGIWVIWSQNLRGNWELMGRRYDLASRQWGKVERLTNAEGADINAVATTDAKGRVWLAWQGWRGDNFDIWLMNLGERKPIRISTSNANDWSPSIAATKDGLVIVAWDTYDRGNYDIWLAQVQGGKVKQRIAVAQTLRFEARPQLLVDAQNRIWVAYEEGDVSWGKDFADIGEFKTPIARFNLGAPLYLTRTIQVKVWANGRLQQPIGDVRMNFPETLQRSISCPRIAADERGRIWLLFRHATNPDGSNENWSSYAVFYDGEQWSAPTILPQSVNIREIGVALALVRGTLVAIYPSDKRPAGTDSRLDSDLFAAVLNLPGEAKPIKLVASSATYEGKMPIVVPYTPKEVVHPNEKQDIARMRSFRLKLGGKTYLLLRGEFHRHTELTAHRDGIRLEWRGSGQPDGSLEDTWRYALDAADFDWMGLGDHDNGYHHEYLWWLSQKTTDLFNHPPRFIGMFTYERSVPYPSGHRNVMFAQRGIRPLPRLGGGQRQELLMGTPERGAPDVKMLYRYLKTFGGICASHTSATNMGTDWRDNDPVAEPVVEIYQGCRQNYEYLGAPRSATKAEEVVDSWQPAGFVWEAFKKGYKLGFQCSSDHVSTHISYAVVFAEAPTREAIVDAFRKRHSYGATDNILLVVTCGEHLMGDAFVVKKPPIFDIYVVGTSPIARLHIIKDFKHVYTTEPKRREVRLRWQDNEIEKGKTSWYYVRVEQEDGQLAWSSPMWIRYE